ncbi:vWA domain-containing protein [Bacteroides propionicifaciens]|uniref:vWA domain-containing protein n=1 Tax=Bacteroides propionicifaciens TaxID=392838 RepID=UPI00037407E5|nr:VWA domain-containing protein [Bacteroides propionicifaciens]
MVFAHIEYLLLLLILIPIIIWYVMRHQQIDPSLQVSDTHDYDKVRKSFRIYLLHLPFILRMAALALLIIVLARPQSTDNWQSSEVEGIDIMMAIDVSGSMLAEDLLPNRLEAAKDVAAKFINDRPNDNIGITLFAGESFTQCPLTIDHTALLNLFENIRTGVIDDGTAIGMGISNAVARLKDSQAKSKVVILLTDGANNAGDISPLTSAEIAKTYGIRVYTIGIGTQGTAPYPIQTMSGAIQRIQVEVDVDEPTLKDIARITDGEYFRATDNESLEGIYQEIDKLEKTKLNVKEFSRRQEEYLKYALAAFLLVLLDVLLRQTVLRKLP